MKQNIDRLHNLLIELNELHELANEYAVLNESGHTFFLMEEEEKQGFLKRVSASIEELADVGKQTVKEIDKLDVALPDSFTNIKAALASARKVVSKKIPSGSFVSKIGGLGMTYMSAMFSKNNDPVETITEISSDVARLATMVQKISTTFKKLMSSNEGYKGVSGDMTIEEFLKSDDEKIVNLRKASGFDMSVVNKLVKAAAKPPTWFSGIKSLAGALGYGIGGDVPLSDNLVDWSGKTALTYKKIMQDIATTTLQDISTFGEEVKPIVKTSTASATDALESSEEIATDAEESDIDLTVPPVSAEMLGDVGLTDPAAAARDISDILAAGKNIDGDFIHESKLHDYLFERPVTYDDLTGIANKYTPEGGDSKAIADKLDGVMSSKLKDSYKGKSVSMPRRPPPPKKTEPASKPRRPPLPPRPQKKPESTKAKSNRNIPKPPPPPSKAELESRKNKKSTPSTPKIPKPPPPPSKKELEAKKAASKSKGTASKSMKPGTYQKLDKPVVSGKGKNKRTNRYKAKGKGPKSKKVRNFASEKAAKAYSLRTERLAIAHMRKHILSETNDFMRTSYMSPEQVVVEFYRLGGTNRMIQESLSEQVSRKEQAILESWLKISGIKQ